MISGSDRHAARLIHVRDTYVSADGYIVQGRLKRYWSDTMDRDPLLHLVLALSSGGRQLIPSHA